MKSAIRLVLVYTLCACIATVFNVGAQWLIHGSLGYWVAGLVHLDQFVSGGVLNKVVFWGGIFAGTAVGLVVKYVLDKKYIFQFKGSSVQKEVKTIVLYTVMGVFTTLIFWGFEWLFEWIWGVSGRYWGALIGLSIGYVVKYYLDKKFVFITR